MAPTAISRSSSPQALYLDGVQTLEASKVTTGYRGYDHVHWYVGNAKQAASHFVTRMGFEEVAFQGLETGNRAYASHVVTNGSVRFVLSSPLKSLVRLNDEREKAPEASRKHFDLAIEMHAYTEKHGDAVRDVAFEVDDVRNLLEEAMKKGVKVLKAVEEIQDQDGVVLRATIKTYGETTHTLIQRSKYHGTFLPGYKDYSQGIDVANLLFPQIDLEAMDHCVGNQDWDGMEAACDYYEKCLGFHRFWSIDDRDICTELTALRTTVMASPNDMIKMPITEPAEGKRKSQVEEFSDFNDGPGVQHIALRTTNIIETVTNMRARGVEFITVPSTYYEMISERLERSGMRIDENFEAIRNLSILIDFDEGGYLLQIFTKPLSDRPTIFLEIIQRHNFSGFGAGNIKSLFEAVERLQEKRGNL